MNHYNLLKTQNHVINVNKYINIILTIIQKYNDNKIQPYYNYNLQYRNSGMRAEQNCKL